MADTDTYVCFFCSGDIKRSDDMTTVPNLGVLVHSRCYRRDIEESEQHETPAAA